MTVWPSYYTDPAKAVLPTSGKTGNYALAAHCEGYGAKFHHLNKLKVGDPIVLETRADWYVYKAYSVLRETSQYNVKVLSQVSESPARTSRATTSP